MTMHVRGRVRFGWAVAAAVAIIGVGSVAHADPPDPVTVGFATLSNTSLNSEPGTVLVVEPGESVSIAVDYVVDHTLADGSVYCPGCIDHVPVAFRGHGPQPQNASPGSPEQCFGAGAPNHLRHGDSGSDSVDLGAAPTTPGTHDIIASFEFSFWCGQFWNPDGGTVIAQVVILPDDTSQCKNGGWQDYSGQFQNQGDCVAYVVTEGSNGPGLHAPSRG